MDTQSPNERKIVSVLFCDIAGSYTYLYDSDPEQGKVILDQAIAHMTTVIERFGGVVNQVQGDGVMSLFGAPLAMEDHAQRACAAATELVATFKQRNAQGEWPNAVCIEIRIGISTGEAVVGLQPVKLPLGGEGYEYFATGAVSHLAGRLQKLAGSFEIALSEETATALGDSASTQAIADRSVHDLINEHSKPLRLTGLRQDAKIQQAFSNSQFVGRAREIEALSESLQSCKDSERSHTVFLVGDPGLGKTRLIRQFLQTESAQACEQFCGSASSIEQNIPFALFRRLLNDWLALDDFASEETRALRLSEQCELIEPGNWLFYQSLRDAFGLPTSDERWRKFEPDIRREEVYRSLQRLIVWWGKRRQTIVFLDDLHWADPISRQLLESLATETLDSTVLLILLSREQLQLKTNDNVLLYDLKPLEIEESRELLNTFPATTGWSEADCEVMLERFGGVPLFLEQVSFTNPPDASISGLQSDETRSGVSPAIRSLIGARIDQLGIDSKKLLTVASVAGARFSRGCLASVSAFADADLDRCLAALIQGGFIEISSGFQEYQFTHALYQEVAYLGILRSRLLKLHAAHLEYFKRVANSRSDSRLDGQLRHHAWHSQNWQDVTSYGAAAARDALDRGAYQEGINYLDQSLHAFDKLAEDVAAVTDDRERERAELLLDLSRACIPMGEFERSYQALEDCQKISRKLDDNHLYCESCAYQTALLSVQRDSATAIASGEEAVRVAEETGSDRLIFGCKVYWAEAQFFHGEFEQVCKTLQLLVDSGVVDRFPLDRVGNTAPASIDCYGILGMSYAQLGKFDQAEHYGELATTIADQTGKSFDRGLAYFYLTYILVHRCRMHDAEVSLKKVVDVVDAGGVRFLRPWVGGLLGFIYATQGQLQQAEELVKRSIDDSRRMSLSIFEVYALVSLAFVQTKAGNFEDAEVTINLADEKARSGKFKSVQMWILRSRGGLALSQQYASKAIKHLKASIAEAEDLGMLPDAAHCHAMLASIQESIGQGHFVAGSGENPPQEFFDYHRDTARKLYEVMVMPAQ